VSEAEIAYYESPSTGTEKYHKFSSWSPLVCTDGVLAFAQEHKAFWALDVVASYAKWFRDYTRKTSNRFFVLTFDVKDQKCIFRVREDTGTATLIQQRISYTDLQVSVKWYFIDGVVLFPSEY